RRGAARGEPAPPQAGVIRVAGACGRGPGRAEIGQFAFQTLDLEPQRPAAGEEQGHHATRRRGLGELDRQQVEHRLLVDRAHVAALAGHHAVEAQGRTAAAKTGIGAAGGLPVQPGHGQGEKLLSGTPDDVVYFDDRVLDVGRYYFDVVVVEGNELHRVHDQNI